MLARVVADSVDVVSSAEIDRTLSNLGSRSELERGGLSARGAEKAVVAFRRGGEGPIYPGYRPVERRDGGHERRRNGVLCQTALEIQSAVGCPFDCSYCPYTRFVSVRLDVETIVEEVAQLASGHRSQTLFKLNNRTDLFGLEPEYGLARALVDRFARLPGKFLLLYSKGDSVDPLLDADHRGRTAVSFTLTPDPIAQLLETGAPAPERRIDAMARLGRAGYPVRVRLSPIVPLSGWREAYRELLARVAAAAQPELVTLWTLSMVTFENLARIVPLDALDPFALEAARASAERMRDQKGAPFPPDLRIAIYREIASLARELLPRAHVALCLETEEVWEALAPMVVPRRGCAFFCNCGPRAVPRARYRTVK